MLEVPLLRVEFAMRRLKPQYLEIFKAVETAASRKTYTAVYRIFTSMHHLFSLTCVLLKITSVEELQDSFNRSVCLSVSRTWQ